MFVKFIQGVGGCPFIYSVTVRPSTATAGRRYWAEPDCSRGPKYFHALPLSNFDQLTGRFLDRLPLLSAKFSPST